MPKKERKHGILGGSENGCNHKRAEYIDYVWSYDFVMDQTEDGRRLKMLPIMYEFTRERLSTDVESSITAKDVIGMLEYLFAVRGVPAYLRSDTGPKFTAEAIKRWLSDLGAGTLYIEPAGPWGNTYIESFISHFEDKLLNCESFSSLEEAKVLGEQYRLDYNHRRLHSSLDYMTPAAFDTGYVPPAGIPEQNVHNPLIAIRIWFGSRPIS